MDSFDELMPTSATLELLSVVGDLQLESLSIIDKLELFETNQIRLSPNDLIGLLSRSSKQLRAQNRLIQKLVEHTLVADEQFQELKKAR